MNLAGDLGREFVECQRRDQANNSLWHALGNGGQVRFTEWRQVGQPINTARKPL
jgi:hypothetical protein